MSGQHLVRIGLMGHVGRFTSVDGLLYPRSARVVCRTSRGLEVGEVLSPCDSGPRGVADGSILRRMTVEDDLLSARLDKNKQAALEACTARVAELDAAATLLDVEHLFDGRKLFFYFLGEVTPEIEAITTDLAQVYEAHSQIGQFADVLTNGCGPGCGTEEASGQGCVSCATGCAVASACSTGKRAG